jgi:hypothetical protein
MIPVYRVKNWDEVFEKSQMRKAKTHHWVAMPIKHDGAGFRRVSIQPNACELFCAWCLIVQVAAKCPCRGVLASDSGEGLDADDLAIKTGFPIRIFEDALEFFTGPKIGWLTTSESDFTPSEKEEKEHAPTKTQSATSETQKTTSGEAHSTVQYNTRQTSSKVQGDEEDFSLHKILTGCSVFRKITKERFALIMRSFPRLRDPEKSIKKACLKATDPDTVIHKADAWLIKFLENEPEKQKEVRGL